MIGKESLIRARYAVSVLRVARNIPRSEAINLIDGPSKDWLDMETDGKIATPRTEATTAFSELAAALRANLPALPAAWDRAADAAARWLRAVGD